MIIIMKNNFMHYISHGGKCNMPSDCITSCGICKYSKPCTRRKCMKGFLRALVRYGQANSLGVKFRGSIHFNSPVESGRRYSYKSMIYFPDSAESQVRGITSGHHLPHEGECLEVRINILSDKGTSVTG